MEMTSEMVAKVVAANIDAGNPVMIAGAPGIGKSDVVRQIAAARNWGLIDLRLSTIDPVDLRGLPSVENGKAVFLPMGELPNVARDGENGILFLDELPQAPMAVQNAAFSLVLDRRIGAYELPDGWHVVAAGNRVSDKAGAGRMNSALANRFAHVDMAAALDSWCKWALANGIPAELVAFMRFRPELLHKFDTDSKVNPTPRSWAMLARHIGKGHPAELETALFAGLVGNGPAAELLAFLRIWRKLPMPDSVFLDPMAASVPADGATLYAIAGALARKVTHNTMPQFLAYIGRLPPEYGVLAMRDATSRDPSLNNTPEAIAWFSANSEIYS